MSEYGLKIKNYEAGSIFEVECGVRNNYDSTDAMLTNSLFLDFLKSQKKFAVWKDESTRDVVCIEFNYGSRSYEEEIKHLEKSKNEENAERIQHFIDEAINNADKFKKMSKQDIRTLYYTKGVDIRYPQFSKDKKVVGYTTIHYKMLYRTPGKAKKGTCMFICEDLYDVAREFLYMGIKLGSNNSPIVEIGAYSSLITSTTVGKIKIDPSEILVLNDVEAHYSADVVSIETDSEKHCVAKNIANYRLKNTLFDGQALIDSSIFPEWADGYILLRHHFCKMAAFSSNIQKFYQDKFGSEYETAKVVDMFGVEHYAKDIKLITTDNALKWLKFDVSYDYWSEWVRKNGCYFGIVKTAHESKLGNVQRMSYQMVNALNEDIMDNVLADSKSYIYQLKNDNSVFLDYLKKNSNFSNDYDALIALCNQNPEFFRSEYFRKRRKDIISSYLWNLKNGRVIQNADNLVIVGSPYAMLMHSVGENALNDPTFKVESDAMQCWTNRFKDGEYLAEFRSPFNSKNNLGYMHNIHHEYFDRYFNFGKLIVAVNMIGTFFQDRNNGSDQDSDSIYTTNQPDIVEYAKYCQAHYPTIVNNIPKEKNNYTNTLENFARIDNELAASQLAIGESSNLAQLCLTYTYNFNDKKFSDYVCILSVVAQAAIDSAKRRFDIDIPSEIKRIKKDINTRDNKYPMFWSVIRKGFNPNNLNADLKCPMNYIYDMNIEYAKHTDSTLPMSYFFKKFELNDRKCALKVEKMIEKYSMELYNYNVESMDDLSSEYLLLRNDFDNLIYDIKQTIKPNKYIYVFSWLINRAFLITPQIKNKDYILKNKINKNKSLLLKTLYEINPDSLLLCFSGKNGTAL